jgi:hypothetical protein
LEEREDDDIEADLDFEDCAADDDEEDDAPEDGADSEPWLGWTVDGCVTTDDGDREFDLATTIDGDPTGEDDDENFVAPDTPDGFPRPARLTEAARAAAAARFDPRIGRRKVLPPPELRMWSDFRGGPRWPQDPADREPIYLDNELRRLARQLGELRRRREARVKRARRQRGGLKSLEVR